MPLTHTHTHTHTHTGRDTHLSPSIFHNTLYTYILAFPFRNETCDHTILFHYSSCIDVIRDQASANSSSVSHFVYHHHLHQEAHPVASEYPQFGQRDAQSAPPGAASPSFVSVASQASLDYCDTLPLPLRHLYLCISFGRCIYHK